MGRAVPERCDVLVVGAGFAGAVMAERMASELGLRVLVIDRRARVAGSSRLAERTAAARPRRA